jgi:hypothetical protein
MTSAEATGPKIGVGRRAVRWMFVNRRNGRLTVAQWPNIYLSVFIVLTLALRIFHPTGGIDQLVRGIAEATLLVWAADETIRGVNPFRRILGLVVIAVTIASLTL